MPSAQHPSSTSGIATTRPITPQCQLARLVLQCRTFSSSLVSSSSTCQSPTSTSSNGKKRRCQSSSSSYSSSSRHRHHVSSNPSHPICRIYSSLDDLLPRLPYGEEAPLISALLSSLTSNNKGNQSDDVVVYPRDIIIMISRHVRNAAARFLFCVRLLSEWQEGVIMTTHVAQAVAPKVDYDGNQNNTRHNKSSSSPLSQKVSDTSVQQPQRRRSRRLKKKDDARASSPWTIPEDRKQQQVNDDNNKVLTSLLSGIYSELSRTKPHSLAVRWRRTSLGYFVKKDLHRMKKVSILSSSEDGGCRRRVLFVISKENMDLLLMIASFIERGFQEKEEKGDDEQQHVVERQDKMTMVTKNSYFRRNNKTSPLMICHEYRHPLLSPHPNNIETTSSSTSSDDSSLLSDWQRLSSQSWDWNNVISFLLSSSRSKNIISFIISAIRAERDYRRRHNEGFFSPCISRSFRRNVSKITFVICCALRPLHNDNNEDDDDDHPWRVIVNRLLCYEMEDAVLELALGWGTSNFSSRDDALIRRCFSSCSRHGRPQQQQQSSSLIYWAERKESRDWKDIKGNVLSWCVDRLLSSSSSFVDVARSRWLLSSSIIVDGDDEAKFLKTMMERSLLIDTSHDNLDVLAASCASKSLSTEHPWSIDSSDNLSRILSHDVHSTVKLYVSSSSSSSLIHDRIDDIIHRNKPGGMYYLACLLRSLLIDFDSSSDDDDNDLEHLLDNDEHHKKSRRHHHQRRNSNNNTHSFESSDERQRGRASLIAHLIHHCVPGWDIAKDVLLPPPTSSTIYSKTTLDHDNNDTTAAALRHYLFHSEGLPDLAQLSLDIFQRVVFGGGDDEGVFLSPRVWEWLRNWLIAPVIIKIYHDLMLTIIHRQNKKNDEGQQQSSSSSLLNDDDKIIMTKANKFTRLMAAAAATDDDDDGRRQRLWQKIFNCSFVTSLLPHAFGIDRHYIRLCIYLSLVFPKDNTISNVASPLKNCKFLKWLVTIIVGNGLVVPSNHCEYEMRIRYHKEFLRIYLDIWGTSTTVVVGSSNDALLPLSNITPHDDDGYPPFDTFITALCQVTPSSSSVMIQNYFRHISNVIIPRYTTSISEKFKKSEDDRMMLRWLTLLFQNQTTTTSLLNDDRLFLWDFHRHLLNRRRRRRSNDVCCYWFLCVIATFVAEQQQQQMGDATKKDDYNNNDEQISDFCKNVIYHTPPEDFCEGNEPGSLFSLKHLEILFECFCPLTLKTVELWTTVMVGIGYHFQDDDDDDDNSHENEPSDNAKKHITKNNDHRPHVVSTQRRGRQQQQDCRTILFRIVDKYLNDRQKDTNDAILQLFIYRVAQELRAHGAERGYQWWTRKTSLVDHPDKKDQLTAAAAVNDNIDRQRATTSTTCRDAHTTTTNASLVVSPQTTTRRTTTTTTFTTIAVKNNNKMSLLERLNDITKETAANSSITANNVKQKSSSQGVSSARKRRRLDDISSDEKKTVETTTIIKTPHNNNDNDQQRQIIHRFDDATTDKMATTKDKNELQTTTTLSSPLSNEKNHDGILV